MITALVTWRNPNLLKKGNVGYANVQPMARWCNGFERQAGGFMILLAAMLGAHVTRRSTTLNNLFLCRYYNWIYSKKKSKNSTTTKKQQKSRPRRLRHWCHVQIGATNTIAYCVHTGLYSLSVVSMDACFFSTPVDRNCSFSYYAYYAHLDACCDGSSAFLPTYFLLAGILN